MDFYRGNIPILDDNPANESKVMAMCFPNKTGFGSRDVGYGCIPRDYAIQPISMKQSPSGMVLIPSSEDDARYDEEEATKSSLEHLYLPGGDTPAFVNLDQNGYGDCWLFSVGQAIMIDRLKQGLPIVRLNPHAGAVILNQLNGGWCGLSMKLAREIGEAEDGTGPGQWPGHSRSSSNDTPALRTAMAKYKVTEEWTDLTQHESGQNLTAQMIKTCHQNKIPVPNDFPWWSHSVVTIRWVRIEAGRWGRLILNSWANWGRHGLAVLEGAKLNTMGAVAVRMSKAA